MQNKNGFSSSIGRAQRETREWEEKKRKNETYTHNNHITASFFCLYILKICWCAFEEVKPMSKKNIEHHSQYMQEGCMNCERYICDWNTNKNTDLANPFNILDGSTIAPGCIQLRFSICILCTNNRSWAICWGMEENESRFRNKVHVLFLGWKNPLELSYGTVNRWTSMKK